MSFQWFKLKLGQMSLSTNIGSSTILLDMLKCIKLIFTEFYFGHLEVEKHRF